MRIALVAIALVIFLLGALGVVWPRALMSMVDRPWRSSAGLYVAVAIRGVFGVLLVVAADGTRFPWTVRVLGIVSLVAAVSLPLLGYERVRKFITWWLARPDAFVRAWSVVACAFGAFLAYAAL